MPRAWPLALLFLCACRRPAAVKESDAGALALEAKHVTSPDGIRYVRSTGFVPSFDGLPLDVDVTVADDGKNGPRPLVVMFHGWTESKTRWQSETRDAPDDAERADWNDVALAARGYAVLTYSIRGWHASCGPARAKNRFVPATLPEDCKSRAYWVHVADPNVEIEDARFLIGRLVDAGIADPEHVGVAGGSYGGAHVWMLALGGAWRSPGGRPIHVAAAAPFDTWASLAAALLPNGRASEGADAPRVARDPVGVPLGSYLDGFFAGGPLAAAAFYAPPGADATSDFSAWFARVKAGAPFHDDALLDPVMHRFLDELDRRSPLYVEPRARVPIVQVQGFTDPLFPAIHALEMRAKMSAYAAAYPIATILGDFGHDNARNPRDQWDVAHAATRALFDHELLGTGDLPPFDVLALTTTCLPGQTLRTLRGPSFAELAHGTRTLRSNEPRTTTNVSVSRASEEIDPVLHHGCRTVSDSLRVASGWSFPIAETTTLVGHPRVTMRLRVVGVDAELNVRMWDVEGGKMTLVSRGTYRFLAASRFHPDLHASEVELLASANAWEFQPRHEVRLEIVGNAFPERQPGASPATITVERIELVLPVVER